MHARAQGKSPRGASLPTVIMVVAMMLTLGFTVVAIAFNHLTLSFKTSNQTQADHLAEAVLAKAIGEIVENPEFGLSGTAADKTVRIVRPSSPDEMFFKLPEGSEGVLTFDETYANDLKIPYSTNNRSEGPISGVAGIPVPEESFHLVAIARVKNCTSKMNAIVTIPKFPYSVAAAGSIRSEGGLVVASVKPGVPYDLRYPIHEDDLRPGHLVSNSKIGDEAVFLTGEGNKIYGDLQSSSGVTLEANASVLGEVRTNAIDAVLPQLDVMDYDPESTGMDFEPVTSGAGTLSVEGYNKYVGDLTVDNGIELNGGVLYVDGNLLVSAGGVTGKGALVATGGIQIHGDGEAHTDNQAALIAEGNIILRGSSSAKAKFAGLIYTEGQLSAENMRLAGVFVAAGDDSSVEFKNTEVYEDPSLGSLEIINEPTPPPNFIVPSDLPLHSINWPNSEGIPVPIPMEYDPGVLQANLESFRNPDLSPGQPEYLFRVPTDQWVDGESHVGYSYYRFDPEDGALDYYFTADSNGPNAPFVLNGGHLGLKINGQAINSQADAVSAIQAAAEEIRGRELNSDELSTVNTSAAMAFNQTTAVTRVSRYSAQYTFENSSSDPSPGGGDSDNDSNFTWSLDLSEFFSEGKPLRVLYWGTYTQ